MDIFDVGSLTARRTMVAAGAILLAYTLINPVGFLGGGWDDWEYLNAARCWVAHGPCLPTNHWQGRWPLIAPLAASIKLFGESRASIGLPSLLATTACLPPLALIGNRLFGAPVGYAGALLFLLTPIVGVELYDPNVEIFELAYLAYGFAALLIARDDPRARWGLILGLSFALAFQTRETAIVPIAVTAVCACIVFPRDRLWRLAIVSAPAFLLPLAIELIVFWTQTGDPLWRRELSLHHVLIPSTELRGPIDRSAPPFFNPNYIANWRHEPGIHIHWAVDGLANFLINIQAGITQWAAPLLLLVYARKIAPGDRRAGWLALAAGLGIACGYIYALAIDPKARMLFPVIALFGIVLAMVLLRLEKAGHRLVGRAILLVAIGTAVFIVAIFQQVHSAEPYARQWIERFPNRIASDENSRRHLALVDIAQSLPEPGESDADMLLIKIDIPCDRWLERGGLGASGWRLVARHPLSVMSYVRPELGGALCLYRAPGPIDRAPVDRAIDLTFRPSSR